ncbi:MAG: hypothetical protein ABL921_03415 [Pirellula sp.]
MKVPSAKLTVLLLSLPLSLGCGANHADVVDLNKVLDALVAVLDEGKKNNPVEPIADSAVENGLAKIGASDGNAEISSTAEIQAIEPDKQDPTKEKEFLTKYAAKLNEMHVMNSPVGVSMTAGGEIVGFADPNENLVQDLGESKEFSVTIDPANKRLVASDNHGYHRPHGYHFSPGGMMMGYMLGSMMGRQGSYYSGPMSSARPNFNNTPMAPADYHKSAASSVRSRTSSASSSSARARTGSKGFSFGK